MINLANKCVLVRTQEEYESVLKEARRQGYRESVFTGSFYCKIPQTCTTTFLPTCDRIYSEVVLWDFIARNEVIIWQT